MASRKASSPGFWRQARIAGPSSSVATPSSLMLCSSTVVSSSLASSLFSSSSGTSASASKVTKVTPDSGLHSPTPMSSPSILIAVAGDSNASRASFLEARTVDVNAASFLSSINSTLRSTHLRLLTTIFFSSISVLTSPSFCTSTLSTWTRARNRPGEGFCRRSLTSKLSSSRVKQNSNLKQFSSSSLLLLLSLFFLSFPDVVDAPSFAVSKVVGPSQYDPSTKNIFRNCEFPPHTPLDVWSTKATSSFPYSQPASGYR